MKTIKRKSKKKYFKDVHVRQLHGSLLELKDDINTALQKFAELQQAGHFHVSIEDIKEILSKELNLHK